ncbi:MAG: hybrid sensor histidine kinase/response regulator, partial [Vicinamibacteraceae bacterium]
FGAFFHNVTDASGGAYLLHTRSGAPKEAFAGFPRPRATSLFEPTFRGEGPVRIDDVTTDARYAQNSPYQGIPPGHVPVRSYLAVPVISRSGGALGGLFFGHSRPGVFLGRHEELATGIASWAALALDNARLYRDAQRANRLKDEFLATLSHELRTPLNVMLGWAHLLRSTVLPGETERRALASIERSAKAQARVVEDLLDVSRIVSGKLQMKSEAVELTSVVSGAVESVRPTAAAKGLTIQLGVAPDTEIMVTGDADRLRQVLWNLLSNALKFTPKGGRVSIALRQTESDAEIIVEDTGQGIPSDFLPHVFERFRQADTAVSRKHVGLGLGLTLVRLLAEAHGGSVAAASAGEGKGATFTVRLPVRAVRGHIPTIARGEPAAGTALTGLHALVVDDEPEARDLLQILLQMQGADVTAVASAGEALNVLAERRIDIVLADIGRPYQDGYALIQAIRALAPDQGGRVPAIAVTAYAAAQDRHRALDAGYGWHLAKPVDPEQLIAAVLAASKSHNIDA